VADTVFDRSLLRAGETVHMKHFIRAKTLQGLSLVPAENLPDTLSITFSGSDQHYDLPLKWSNAENDWRIPQSAKLGTYNVTTLLKTPGPTPVLLTTGDFRVEEFRIPLMKAAIKVPAPHRQHRDSCQT
jgi:hypothetical protein